MTDAASDQIVTTFSHSNPTPASRGVVPISTMFEMLERRFVRIREQGYEPHVGHIRLETGSMREFYDYLRTRPAGERVKETLAAHPGASLTLYGADDMLDDEKAEMRSWLLPTHSSPPEEPRINFHKLETGFENCQSRNVIEIKTVDTRARAAQDGDMHYLYYFPHLETRNEKPYMPDGVHFMPISEDDAQGIDEDIRAGHKSAIRIDDAAHKQALLKKRRQRQHRR
jgi:hypothetical protein